MVTKKVSAHITVALLMLCCIRTVWAGEPIGYVTSLKGTISVLHAGEHAKTALSLNDPVYLGDTITTDPLSRIQILMEDESVFTLGENGLLTIDEHRYQPARDLRSSLYKLIMGSLRVVVGKLFRDPESRVAVETPTSVIGIRMTEFIVQVVSPELTVVITLEGEVSARNIRPDLVCEEKVKRGYESRIAKDTCPSAPTKTPSEKMEEILRETEPYLFPPDKEMPFSREFIDQSVQNAVALVPMATILSTGMMGTAEFLQDETIINPLSAGVTTLQLQNIQPGEVSGTLPVTPVLPPITPLPPIPIIPIIPTILPTPPPPPH